MKILHLYSSSGCCSSVTLCATGSPALIWPNYLGTYVDSQGKKQYKHSNGMYLYSQNPGTWHVAHSDGKGGWIEVIKSDATAPCPDSISQWQYYDNVDWNYGQITVSCS